MRKRIAVAAAAMLLALTACGGGEAETKAPEASDPMVAIDEALSDIDSGRIQVAIRAISPDKDPVAFEMSGTFSEATDEKSLPIADLKYSDRSGVKPQDSSFISDGERAWVVNNRGTKELEGEQLDRLRGGGDVAGLGALNPKGWFEDKPREREGEPVGGEPTTSYSGEIDTVAVIEDILSVSANLGAYAVDKVSDADREQIRAAAHNAALEVVAGTDDHLLRTVKFGVDVTGDLNALAPVLRELAASRIEFELSVTEINEPVDPPNTPEGAEV